MTTTDKPCLPECYTTAGRFAPASDAEISEWLCGGRDGGCEDWPECEYCRMVARIEVEKDRADRAEVRVKELEDAIVNWETAPQYRVTYLNWLHGVARAILAARARKEGVGR